MDIKVEKLENSQVKLDITVESAKFDEAMDKVYKKKNGHIGLLDEFVLEQAPPLSLGEKSKEVKTLLSLVFLQKICRFG